MFVSPSPAWHSSTQCSKTGDAKANQGGSVGLGAAISIVG